MKQSMIVLGALVAFVATSVASAHTHKKSVGVLVVGTQTEVRSILEGTRMEVKFSEENPNAMVAVALTRKGMLVYERGAVDDILKLIGGAVTGGVVLTLKVGSALWSLLMTGAHTVLHIGEDVLKAAAWVLSNTTTLILNGVDFTVQLAGDVLKFAGDILSWIVGG